MSFMFEVYYQPPADLAKEAAVTEQVAALGGRLDYREDAAPSDLGGICLTFEFDDYPSAEKAAAFLRGRGEHVEGPATYG